jgi:hypothetical protein
MNGQMPRLRPRLVISAAIGLASGGYCWFLLQHFRLGAADFNWAIWAAQDLLAHRNPYGRPMQLYPLPAALFGLPFVWSRPEVAAGVFYGIGSALLAFGLSGKGYHRLLVFLAYPYWAGLIAGQWTPLLMASAFFPSLLPVTIAKPQLGLPVLVTHASRRSILACIIVGTLSLAVMPQWPLLWIAQLGQYNRFIPLLVWPGPVLLLAVLRYRHRDAVLLLLAACMPQRWFYDSFLLWLIPKTRREIVWTVFFSWGAGIWRWYHIPHTFSQVGRWAVLFLHVPMLVVVLCRQNTPREINDSPAADIPESLPPGTLP